MPEEFSELQTLLRLKRYENPPPGYLEDFLGEFHRRQRAELLRRPLWRIALDRLENLIPTLPVPNLAYAGASVVALVAAAGLLTRQSVAPAPSVASVSSPASVNLPARNSSFAVAPITSVRIAPDPDDAPFGASAVIPSFSVPSSRASVSVASDRPRYLLDTRPVRYESRSTSF